VRLLSRSRKSVGRLWRKATTAVSAVIALALLAGAGQAVTIEGGKMVFRGAPLFIKGAMYYQPYAYHQYFWEEWDREQFVRDLEAVVNYGLNTLALQINWGSFAAKVDASSGITEWNEKTFADLRFALERMSERGLLAILWTGTARTPEGVEANYDEGWTDAGGKTHAPYHGYLLKDWPAMAANDTPVWKAMLEFHRKVAEACAEFDNVLYDPLDWQHININYWSFGDAGNLAVWRGWLRSRNPDLQYWNERWDENNASWDEVIFPVDDWVEQTAALLGPPYQGRPRDPHDGSKWTDFRDWHDPLCNNINARIIAAIRAGDPEAVIGQRVDIWHFGDWRQRTWTPQGVDFICQGTYPERPEQISQETVRKEIRVVRERTPRQLPILFWETGLSAAMLPQEARGDFEGMQTEWFNCVQSVAREENLLGFCWWVWQDYYMTEASMTFGLVGNRGQLPILFRPARFTQPAIVRVTYAGELAK